MDYILTRKDERIRIDEEDYEYLTDKDYFGVWRIDGQGYAVTHDKLKYKNGIRYNIRMHRLLMGDPKGKQVDHINGDTLDNRKENLRVCTNSQNSMNKRSTHGSSKYRGVSWHNREKRWIAEVWKDGKRHWSGHFKDEIEAAKNRDIKSKEIHGKFACLNFPKN